MDALVLRVAARHGRGAEFHRFDGAAVRVGRGLDNDLVVPDPYVGAEQFRFRREGGAILLDVLDDTNPVHLNGSPCRGTGNPLVPGDRVAAGHTVFEILLAGSPVPPARRLPVTRWARLGAWRPALAVLMLVVAALAALLYDYLDTYETPEWGVLASGSLALVLVMLGWAGLWAIVGRLLRNETHFSTQLFASALVTLLTMELTLAAPYVAYATGIEFVVGAVRWVLSPLLCFALVWVNLRYATNLRHPGPAAACAVALLLLLVHGLEWMRAEPFSPYPVTETLLRPPFAKLQEGVSLDVHQARLEGLFAAMKQE